MNKPNTSEDNILRGVFMGKKRNDNINIESDGTKRIIDLRRFLEHDIMRPDDNNATFKNEGRGEINPEDL